MSAKTYEIHSFTYLEDGKIVTAVRLAPEHLRRVNQSRAQLNLAPLMDDCNCGDEYCSDGFIIRCVALGAGGACGWYRTSLVC